MISTTPSRGALGNAPLTVALAFNGEEMKTLKSLLYDLQINTKEQLKSYIDKSYGTKNTLAFKILKRSDLIRGDPEDRGTSEGT
jgi:hypothetical protein